MFAFEVPTNKAFSSPEYEPNHLRKAAGAILHFAGRVVDGVAQLVAPAAPPDALSEHFGHAEKRNDLNPPVDLSQVR